MLGMFVWPFTTRVCLWKERPFPRQAPLSPRSSPCSRKPAFLRGVSAHASVRHQQNSSGAGVDVLEEQLHHAKLSNNTPSHVYAHQHVSSRLQHVYRDGPAGKPAPSLPHLGSGEDPVEVLAELRDALMARQRCGGKGRQARIVQKSCASMQARSRRPRCRALNPAHAPAHPPHAHLQRCGDMRRQRGSAV